MVFADDPPTWMLGWSHIRKGHPIKEFGGRLWESGSI